MKVGENKGNNFEAEKVQKELSINQICRSDLAAVTPLADMSQVNVEKDDIHWRLWMGKSCTL